MMDFLYVPVSVWTGYLFLPTNNSMEILDSAINMQKEKLIYGSDKNSGSRWLLCIQVFIRTQNVLEAYDEVNFHKHFKSLPSISYNFAKI